MESTGHATITFTPVAIALSMPPTLPSPLHPCRMDFELGGNNHFDICVFRNPGPDGMEKPMEILRLGELSGAADFDTGLLYNEQVKEACLIELIEFANGNLAAWQLRSNIESHALTVRMMSAIYEAHARRAAGRGDWVNAEIERI